MLQISNVSKTYRNGVKALTDVSLTIDRGMFGLLGPNGAGKSTLMRTIATLQEPDTGSILFDGVDTVKDADSVRRQLGYLPQDFGVYPRISAFELLDHLALLKGAVQTAPRREQVSELLQQTNLYEARKKPVSTFSGGMRQRFGIAQALLGNPKLIVVDEPTAGLDPEERNRFHNLLSEIGENVVVILSTHIVSDVRDLCPQMAVLANGRIVLEGSPATLIDKLCGRVWSKTIPKSELPIIRDSFQVLSTHLFAGQTRVHVLASDRPDSGYELMQASLEDVYFSVLAQTSEFAEVK